MKKNTSKDLILIASALLLGLTLMATPYISRGQTTVTTDGKYTVLVPLPCIEGNGISCEGRNGALQDQVDFKTYVQYTFNLFIGLSAATAVVMIIWGSVEYIVSSSLYDKKSGLEKAKNAVYGLILVLTSFIILRTVDPRFTQIPNTIVPQITYETYLLDNPYRKLFEAIETDSSKLTLRSIQIGQNVQESRQNVASATEKLNLTNSSLEDLKKNASTTADQEKIKQLELQRKTELDALNKATIDREIATMMQSINGQILNTVRDLESLKNHNDEISDAIKAANVNKNSLKILRDEKTIALNKLGQYDLSIVNQETNYAETFIDLYKINLSAISVSRIITPEEGKYIEFVDINGQTIKNPDGGKNEAVLKTRDYIKKQLDYSKLEIDSLKDENKKIELLNKIDQINKIVDSGPLKLK